MGRWKNTGKHILSYILAFSMLLSVMPPMKAQAGQIDLSGAEISFWVGEDQVDPATAYTYTGQEIRPQIKVKLNGSVLTEGTDYFVAYANNTKNTSGASPEDKAKVTVYSYGNYEGTCERNFEIQKVSLSTFWMEFDDERVKTVGTEVYMFGNGTTELKPELKVYGINANTNEKVSLTDNEYTVSYSNNTSVGSSPARVTVELKADGNYQCAATDSVEKEFNIYYDLSADTVKTDVAAMTYNGYSVVPAPEDFDVTVHVTDGNRTLTKNVDYTVDSWTETTKAGDTSITIHAVPGSNYRGNKTFTYPIKPYNISGAAITLINGPYYYTGTGQDKRDMSGNVKVEIKTLGHDDVLVSQDDYEVTYINPNPGAIGTNTLRITGRNNLTGYKDIQFKIIQGLGSAAIANQSVAYTGNAVSVNDIGLVVKDASGAEVGTTGYQVTYYYNDAEYQEENKVDAPTKVGTYYLKIEGKDNYDGTLQGEEYSFSIVKQSFANCKVFLTYGNVEDRQLSTGNTISVDYRAGGMKLRVTKVQDPKGNNLSWETDYTYQIFTDEGCSNEATYASPFYVAENAGTYYIRVQPAETSNYEGAVTFQFVVNPATVKPSDLKITIPDQTYTGSEIIPDQDEMTVTYAGNVISKDSYDIVSVENNIAIQSKDNAEAKRPTVKIRLKGNYQLSGGSDAVAEGYFSIVPKKITDCQCNLVEGSTIFDEKEAQKTYTGAVLKPTIILNDGSRTMTEGRDYQIDGYYSDASCTVKINGEPKDAGDYYVKITGLGNYADPSSSIKALYVIEKKRIDSDVISCIVNNPGYTQGVSVVNRGEDPLVLILRDQDTELVEETDYQIVNYYQDANCIQARDTINSGAVYIKISGKGNYTGSRVQLFYIGTNLADKIAAFDVSGWTYDVNSSGEDVSYYEDIDAEISSTVRAGLPMTDADSFRITYFRDAARTIVVTDDDPIFSSAGTIYYRITGKDGYYGSIDGTAVIAQKDLSKLTGEILGTYIYNYQGAAQTVADYDNGLQKGVKLYSYAEGDNKWLLDNTGKKQYTITNGTAYTDVGTYNIILQATADGNYTGTKTLQFTIEPKELRDVPKLKVAVTPATYANMAQTPKVTLTYDTSGKVLDSSNYIVELYKDADYTQKADDEDCIDAGTLYVKLTGRGNYTGTIDTADYPATVQGDNQFVIKPKDISTAKVDIEGKDYVYSNGLLEFVVTQDFTSASTTYTKKLTEGTDYTYEALQSGFKVGEQLITLTGQGNYTGSRTFKFYYAGNINDASHATVKLGDGSGSVQKSFTGSALTLADNEIVVTDTNGNILRTGTQYSVTYTDNVGPGEATVVITGIKSAHWTGTYYGHFDIIGDLSDSRYTTISLPDQAYTGKEYNTTDQPLQNLEVKFNGKTLTQGKDYEIVQFDNATNMSTNGAKVTIHGIGSFKGYAEKTFSIKYNTANLIVSLDPLVCDYDDGREIKPEVTLRYPTGTTYDTSFTEGVDYTVSYHNNVNVCAANGLEGPYVQITPKDGGKLAGGSVTKAFTIRKIDISQCVISGVRGTYTYTGDLIRPDTLQVMKSDGTIIDPVNYDIAYSTDASNPATAPAGSVETITVKGKGNYSGSVTKELTITKRNLATSAVCTIADQLYSGRALTPNVNVTITDENGEERTLTAGTDFVVETYANNVAAANKGSANAPYALISGTGSCTGEVQVEFNIQKRAMSELVYQPVTDPQYVPGKLSYTPEVKVYFTSADTEPLTAGVDYRVTYYNNTAVMAEDGVNGPYLVIEPTDTSNFEGSHVITFSILPKDVSSEDIKVSLSDTLDKGFDSVNRNYVYDRDKVPYTPTATLTFDDGSTGTRLTPADYDISYENNDEIGTAYVVITGRGNYTGERRVAFTIGTLIANDTITVTGISNKVYNGQDTTPTDIRVKFNAKDEYLTEDVDYTVGYYLDETCQSPASLSDMQNAGRIYVGITGTADANAGGYVGTAVIPYTILQKSLTSSDILISGNDDVNYTGEEVYPNNLQLTDTTTGRVIDASQYTVRYENNVDIGTASATVTATETGNYKDSITVYYRVTKHDISAVVAEAIPDQTYTGDYIIPEMTIYDNGVELVKGQDYEVVNGNNLRAGESWVIIQGIGNYDQTKRVYFNIIANMEAAIVDDIPDQLYTGSAVTPVERVACGGNTLQRGVDYTVAYANNTAVGDASITITPTSKYYTGTIVKKFTITNSIAAATITVTPNSYRYTGEAYTPEPVVTLGGVRLTKNVDYTVVYRNNVNVGTASVIVIGLGKYSSSKTANFSIVERNIENCSIYMVSSQSFTGKRITPPVVVKDGNTALEQGKDYMVSYSNNLDIGTGTATITGSGDYDGTVQKEFTIVAENPITTVLVQNKNESAGTFDVLVDGAAEYVDLVKVRVWSKGDRSDAYTYEALRVDGDTFIAHVNAANHGYTSGAYQILVLASGQNYSEHEVHQTATTFSPQAHATGSSSGDSRMSGEWQASAAGWWYEYTDGSYAANEWKNIDGTWYWFDGSGYMVTGWQQINGSWYYFGNDGCMRTGWVKLGDVWYYLQDSGAMATGWQQIDGNWYWFDGSGAMATGWQLIDGVWYYLKSSGELVTGWLKIGNHWYYMKDSGAMATGWQKIAGSWYYMYGSGVMASNTWIGNDYVNGSGQWTRSR